MRMPTRLRRLEHSLVCPPHALALGVLAELAAVLGPPNSKVDPRMLVVLPHAWHARPHAVRRAPWPHKFNTSRTARSRRCIVDQLGMRATVHEHDVPGHSRPQLPTRPAATEPTSSMVARWCFGTSSAACANNSSKCSIPEGPGVGIGPSDNAWTRIP